MRVQADTLPLRRWLAAAAEPTAVLVACREHPQVDLWLVPRAGTPQVVYRLEGCLADLPPAALLEILAGGAPSVTALLDGCANPPAARRVVSRARAIAALVAVDRSVGVLTDPPAPEDRGVPQAKRGVPRRVTPLAQVEVLDARAMPVSRRALAGLDGALGNLEAHSGLRLYAVVRELLAGAPVPSALDDVPTGAARLDAARCSGSGACVLTCPTQALTLTVTDLVESRAAPSESQVVGGAAFSDDGLQQFVLSVDPALCIDCGQCVEMCPESAMSRVGPLPWAQALSGLPTTLRVGMIRRCSHCGMPNNNPGSLCGVCAFRAAEPFGSQLPPGFTRAGRL